MGARRVARWISGVRCHDRQATLQEHRRPRWPCSQRRWEAPCADSTCHNWRCAALVTCAERIRSAGICRLFIKSLFLCFTALQAIIFHVHVHVQSIHALHDKLHPIRSGCAVETLKVPSRLAGLVRDLGGERAGLAPALAYLKLGASPSHILALLVLDCSSAIRRCALDRREIPESANLRSSSTQESSLHVFEDVDITPLVAPPAA
ncbi:hypothetical protein M432DRAFT_590844 [Thermoascus aurantiacus ATCC 26904]